MRACGVVRMRARPAKAVVGCVIHDVPPAVEGVRCHKAPNSYQFRVVSYRIMTEGAKILQRSCMKGPFSGPGWMV